MGYLNEKKLKEDLKKMGDRIEERLARLEKFMEEASKPRPNEPAENKAKEEINKVKEDIEKKVDKE